MDSFVDPFRVVGYNWVQCWAVGSPVEKRHSFVISACATALPNNTHSLLLSHNKSKRSIRDAVLWCNSSAFCTPEASGITQKSRLATNQILDLKGFSIQHTS